MCSCVNVKARGQLWRHNFLLPPSCGSTGSNSGRQDYMASVLPSDHFASPYLASFLMYWLQVELLNFLKQYKLLSCMKTKAWECSVYNTVHIVESSSWDVARGALGAENRGDKPTALRGLCGSAWILDRWQQLPTHLPCLPYMLKTPSEHFLTIQALLLEVQGHSRYLNFHEFSNVAPRITYFWKEELEDLSPIVKVSQMLFIATQAAGGALTKPPDCCPK